MSRFHRRNVVEKNRESTETSSPCLIRLKEMSFVCGSSQQSNEKEGDGNNKRLIKWHPGENGQLQSREKWVSTTLKIIREGASPQKRFLWRWNRIEIRTTWASWVDAINRK